MREWIEWSGGEPPVPFGVEVEVKLRDRDLPPFKGSKWDWSHMGNRTDIIAYRIVNGRAAEQKENGK